MPENPDSIHDAETERLQKHIDELTEQLKEIAGGEFPMGFSDDCPLEIREKFLEHVLAFETRPEVSILDELERSGIDLPEAENLNEEELALKLKETVQAMALLGAYLEHTDHMSDRELYIRLRSEVLPEPTVLMPEDPSFAVHFDLVGTGSEEDIQLYLRYYADGRTRRRWIREHPTYRMPAHRQAPFDRDRNLPQPPRRPVPKPQPA